MDKKKLQEAKKMAKKNYTIVVSEAILSDGKKSYMAKNIELFGCMAQGTTINEALQNLEEARVDYIYSSLEDNIDIPEPAFEAITTLDTSSVNVKQFTVNKQWHYPIEEKTQTNEYSLLIG